MSIWEGLLARSWKSAAAFVLACLLRRYNVACGGRLLQQGGLIKSNQFYLDTAYLTNDSGVFTIKKKKKNNDKKKKISETNYNHLHH